MIFSGVYFRSNFLESTVEEPKDTAARRASMAALIILLPAAAGSLNSKVITYPAARAIIAHNINRFDSFSFSMITDNKIAKIGCSFWSRVTMVRFWKFTQNRALTIHIVPRVPPRRATPKAYM